MKCLVPENVYKSDPEWWKEFNNTNITILKLTPDIAIIQHLIYITTIPVIWLY